MKILLISSLLTGAAAVPFLTQENPPEPKARIVAQEADEVQALTEHLRELRLRRADLERHMETHELRMELQELERLEKRVGDMRARQRELEAHQMEIERRAEQVRRDVEREMVRLSDELNRLDESRHQREDQVSELRQILAVVANDVKQAASQLDAEPKYIDTGSDETVLNPKRVDLSNRAKKLQQTNEELQREERAIVDSIAELAAQSEEVQDRLREMEHRHGAEVGELHEVARDLEREREELEHRADYELRREELERQLERTEARHALEQEQIRLDLEIERVERRLDAEQERRDWRAERAEPEVDELSQWRLPEGPAQTEPVVVKDDFVAARARAAAEGKPLLVNFTGHTCVNGRKMEQFVFEKEPIRTQLTGFVEARLHSDTADGELRADIARRIEEVAKSHAQPIYVALDPRTGRELARFEGATLRDVKPFGLFLQNASHASEASGDAGVWEAVIELQDAVRELQREVEALKQHAERVR